MGHGWEDQRKLYLGIADVAEDAGEDEQSYLYLPCSTNHTSGGVNSEARTLSVRALRSALSHPSHFDFQDLTALDSIQALRKSESTFFELLEIFNAEQLDDYDDFKDEHEGWIEEQG
jgi:translation initiation factor 3 subunit M